MIVQETNMKKWKTRILMILLTIVMVSQLLLCVIFYSKDDILLIRNVGWIIWFLSALFGWWPIFSLKSKGKVTKGKSYINTTVLVDSGLYAIIRHPQYLSGDDAQSFNDAGRSTLAYYPAWYSCNDYYLSGNHRSG